MADTDRKPEYEEAMRTVLKSVEKANHLTRTLKSDVYPGKICFKKEFLGSFLRHWTARIQGYLSPDDESSCASEYKEWLSIIGPLPKPKNIDCLLLAEKQSRVDSVIQSIPPEVHPQP